MKNSFSKDIRRDFKKSSGRFIGMFAIVALGVFIFSGLGSTGILMRNIGDRYFDSQNFMDINVISTFGLRQKDIDAIKQIDGIKEVWGSYSMDGVVTSGTSSLIAKISSFSLNDRYSQINTPSILSGRFPEKADEILVEPAVIKKLGISIGDKITLESGKPTDIRSRLKTNTFTVVGTVSSPVYFSFERGSSTVGRGVADCFLILPEESFRQNVYTELYISVQNADSLSTYSNEYKNLIDDIISKINTVADIRIPLQKIELTSGAYQALADGQRELAQSQQLADYTLSDAQNSLDLGNNQLVSARFELEDANIQLADNLALLDLQEGEITDSLALLDASIANLDGVVGQIKGQIASLDNLQSTLYDGQRELVEGKKTALGSSSLLSDSHALLANALYDISENIKELSAKRERLTARQAELLEQRAAATSPGEIAELEGLLDDVEMELFELDATTDLLLAKEAQLGGELNAITESFPELQSAFAQLRKNRTLLAAKQLELNSYKNEADKNLRSYSSLRDDLVLQREEARGGLLEIADIRLELTALSQLIDKNRNTLIKNNQELIDSEKSLLVETAIGAEKLTTAAKQLDENRTKLLNLADPRWYVLDRDSNLGFNRYDAESSQINKIGGVIPLLFFLVAALVSLTTMTRLVEEQRTLMGTYKALGYGNSAILLKYLFFAFIPTFLGSVVGGLLGLEILPSVIVDGAFGKMYNIPPYAPELNIPYLLIGTLLAVFSTVITTFFTCIGELRNVPATLMRPKAPKVGGKTPMEYITFVWKRLSFIYKVTFRNIFRYKKRLFMTIAGVGGSTALLLTGLGLNDSLQNLVPTQYKTLLNYDIIVSFSDEVSSGSFNQTAKKLSNNPLVTSSLRLNSQNIKVHNGDGKTQYASLVVPLEDNYKDYITFRTRLWKNPINLVDDGVVIPEKMATSLGVEIGDSFILRDLDDKEFSVTVSGIYEAYLSSAVYFTPNYYTEIFGKPPKQNSIYAKFAPNSNPADGDLLSNTLLDSNGVSSVLLSTTQQKTFSNVLESLISVIFLIISVAALLAFVVLLNLTNINLSERMREIATIEVLGFRDKEVAAYIYRENFIVTFLSSLIGVYLGGFLHAYICISVESDQMMFIRNISLQSYLLAIILTMLFALITAFITSPKLKKINMIEALKSIE